MKWMLVTTVAGALAIAAAAGAQSARSMDKPMKNDMKEAVYTGCIESSPAGGLQLTHVDAGHEMSMKGGKMSSDATMMAHDGGGANGMSDDHMMSSNVRLAESSKLDKHVGQKVTIKGSLSHASGEGMAGESATLRVTSLKVVSKSCS